MICKCVCHKGIDMQEFKPCCKLCYQVYLNKDGSVNELLLKAAEKKAVSKR